MVGIALAKSIYAVPTWTRLVALVTEHAALRATATGSTPTPTIYACDRFTAKLRANGDMLARDIDRVTAPCTPSARTSAATRQSTSPTRASRKSTRRASADCRNRRRKRSCADGRLAYPLLVRGERLSLNSATLACVHDRRSTPRVGARTASAPGLHGKRQPRAEGCRGEPDLSTPKPARGVRSPDERGDSAVRR
jgi:hypothetical protein